MFGFEIGYISLGTALLGVLLSLFNYYKMTKPANIIPNEIINYGLISSSYQESYKLCIPLIFHNDGAKNGMITSVKIGFKTNDKINYLDVTGKAKLNELVDENLESTDWDGFAKHGYRIVQPTYPIQVQGFESADIVLICTTPYEDKFLPIDSKSECVIEIKFGKNKTNQIKFPFYLAESVIPDDRIIWLPTIANEE